MIIGSSKTPDRRTFLKGARASGLWLGTGALGLAAWERQALAQASCGSWGDIVGSVGAWTCSNFAGYLAPALLERLDRLHRESRHVRSSAPRISNAYQASPKRGSGRMR